MKRYALIVAGGAGSRMNSEIPKQFLKLGNKPVLMHTLEAFKTIAHEIILVLPENQIEHWNDLIKTYHFDVAHEVMAGGNKRFNSVKNGLHKIPDKCLVAIHDGVRPIISKEIIQQSFNEAEKNGNAIVAVKLKDSIREVSGKENFGRNRENYFLIQTPQTFKSELIKTAYYNASEDDFTDDASVYEKSFNGINLIKGDYRNIKITTPDDLIFASALLSF